MNDGMAQVTYESFGIRVQCSCGQEQFYSGVDDHVYACARCHREYQVSQTAATLTIVQATRRAR